MRSVIQLRLFLSMALIFFFSAAIAQNASDGTVEKLLKVYKDKGVEATLIAYEKENTSKEYEGLQEPLNQLGYRIMNGENDPDAAAKIFMAQIEEYPDKPNPYDSYADAMMKKGNEEEAKKHLQKSISLMDNWEDKEASKNLMTASKSKLARLEGKHKSMDFLVGDWEMKNYSIKDGEKTLRFSDDVSFESSKYNSVIITRFINEEDKFEGTQIMTYNAVNDEFDVMRVDNNLMNGFEKSTFKVKESSDNKIVMIETSEENGVKKTVKHIFNKKDGDLEWEIHEKDKSDKENMVAVNIMTKKN